MPEGSQGRARKPAAGAPRASGRGAPAGGSGRGAGSGGKPRTGGTSGGAGRSAGTGGTTRGSGTGGASRGTGAGGATRGAGSGGTARGTGSGAGSRGTGTGGASRGTGGGAGSRGTGSSGTSRSTGTGSGTGRGAGTGTGRPARGGRPPERSGPPRAGTRTERPERPERAERPVGPALPPDADPRLLPNDVRRELRTLPEPTAERIAAHLVAAGMLVDDDPAAAYEHAKYAKTLASRVGAVREAVGVTAYRAGDFAAALTELKAARRITGLADHLPLLADCERALGHPERALAYANDPDRARLDRASQVELTIVLSGARRDMGQPEAAVLALQGPELDSDAVEPWTPRLWYAYADALLEAGRPEDALSWFGAVAAIDEDDETDAPLRAAELSRR